MICENAAVMHLNYFDLYKLYTHKYVQEHKPRNSELLFAKNERVRIRTRSYFDIIREKVVIEIDLRKIYACNLLIDRKKCRSRIYGIKYQILEFEGTNLFLFLVLLCRLEEKNNDINSYWAHVCIWVLWF